MGNKLHARDTQHQRNVETWRWRRPAQVSSVLAALVLTLIFPPLGTPVLAALGVVTVWVETRNK